MVFSMSVILVVEDQIMTLDLAGMCLEDCGHEVLLAASVDEALSYINSGEPIDALFTDIYLNADVFGGCEVARQAQRSRPQLRILYTTGNLATAQLKDQLVEGSHFLTKPYSPNQLAKSVTAMLGA